jgi:hypothetical protein
MTKHVLAVLAYIFATFATQAVSHFALFTEHYAAVTYMRHEPVFQLGILAMLVQGIALSYLYSRTVSAGSSLFDGVRFGWIAGSVLVSYIAFAEAAKYNVPGVSSWLGTEIGAGFVQFTLYGALLGLIYARFGRSANATAALR